MNDKTNNTSTGGINTIHHQADAVADSLCHALADNHMLLNTSGHWKPPLRELLAAVLTDTADDYPCHDWIGEALSRREECAALIAQVGELRDQLRDETRAKEAAAGQVSKYMKLYEQACTTQEELRTRDAAQRAGWPAPSEGMTATDNTEPLNGYIVVYPDHPDAGHMIVNKLSEYDNIRGMDGDGTIITDVEDEIAVCYELDAQVMPVRSVRWEEV